MMARANAPIYDTDDEFEEAGVQHIRDECESARVERMESGWSGRGRHRGRLTQLACAISKCGSRSWICRGPRGAARAARGPGLRHLAVGSTEI